MQPEGTVKIVVDSEDDPALGVELARRSGPTSGVVLVRPIPRVWAQRGLASEVLIGLGKRHDALVREKQGLRAWPMVEFWLQAEQIRHVIVADADRLGPPPLWAALAGLAKTMPIKMWMVTSTTAATKHQAEAAGTPEQVEVAALLDALPRPVLPPPEVGEVEGPLPGDSFLTFRASCRDLLVPTRYEAIDRIYRSAYHGTTGIANWLNTTMQPPTKAAVLEHLRRLTGNSGGPAETLVRLRAAQAAFFTGGLLVNGQPAWSGWGELPAIGLTPAAALRLRRLVSPHLCAAYAIKAAYRQVDPWKLRVGAVGPGGSSLILAGGALPFPEHGRAFIEVQRFARLKEGADLQDPLFANPGGTPMRTHMVRRNIRKASQLAGVGDPFDALRPLWQGPWPRGFVVEVTDVAPVRDIECLYVAASPVPEQLAEAHGNPR